MSDKNKCDNCEELYNPDNQGHYDENTNLNFCQYECEGEYDKLIGLPEDYDRYDDHPPYCTEKCDQCKNKQLDDCHTFEPIETVEK